MYELSLRLHWNLFTTFKSTTFQYWFGWWLGADQAISRYLKQCWLVYWGIYASLGLNELTPVKHWLNQAQPTSAVSYAHCRRICAVSSLYSSGTLEITQGCMVQNCNRLGINGNFKRTQLKMFLVHNLSLGPVPNWSAVDRGCEVSSHRRQVNTLEPMMTCVISPQVVDGKMSKWALCWAHMSVSKRKVRRV